AGARSRAAVASPVESIGASPANQWTSVVLWVDSTADRLPERQVPSEQPAGEDGDRAIGRVVGRDRGTVLRRRPACGARPAVRRCVHVSAVMADGNGGKIGLRGPVAEGREGRGVEGINACRVFGTGRIR